MRLLLLGIFAFSTGCDSCLRGDECLGPYEVNYFSFVYLDSNGISLISTSNQKYDVSEVKVYSIDSNSEKIYARLYCANGTSIVDVTLPYILERSFLEIQGDVTDTLDFTFVSTDSKCCGTTFTIETAAVNGTPYPDDRPMVIIERN